MNREQALAEIRRRAQRQHGTLVLALNKMFEEFAETRRHNEQRFANEPVRERGLGYMLGTENTIGRFEDMLCEAFNVWWDEPEPDRWRDRVPSPERAVDLTRDLWEVLVAALDEDATADQRMEARLQLGLVAWDTWHTDPTTPRGEAS